MKTIYIVWDWDERIIEAVFSTKEKAKEYSNTSYYLNYMEYIVDPDSCNKCKAIITGSLTDTPYCWSCGKKIE